MSNNNANTESKQEHDKDRNDLPNGGLEAEVMPQVQMKKIIESLEMTALQRTSQSGVDISTFSHEQKDKLLDIMSKNEDHAFEYNIKRLDVSKELNSKALNASIVNQKTVRFLLIGGGFGVFILFVLILFFKPEFLSIFLSFITGIMGGFGLKSAFSSLKSSSSITVKDEGDDD